DRKTPEDRLTPFQHRRPEQHAGPYPPGQNRTSGLTSLKRGGQAWRECGADQQSDRAKKKKSNRDGKPWPIRIDITEKLLCGQQIRFDPPIDAGSRLAEGGLLRRHGKRADFSATCEGGMAAIGQTCSSIERKERFATQTDGLRFILIQANSYFV